MGEIASALAENSKNRASLFGMSTGTLNALWIRAARLANLPESNLRRLRHGGASMDVLPGVEPMEIQCRGFWKSPRSVARYRKPGAYLRELAKLPAQQIEMVSALELKLCSMVCSILRQRRWTQIVSRPKSFGVKPKAQPQLSKQILRSRKMELP